jgi:hypothetical protein
LHFEPSREAEFALGVAEKSIPTMRKSAIRFMTQEYL